MVEVVSENEVVDPERQAVYDEFFSLLVDPSGDPIYDKPFEYGDDVWGFCPIHETGGYHRRRSMHITLKKGCGLYCFGLCPIPDVMQALRDGGAPEDAKREIKKKAVSKFSTDFTAADQVASYLYEKRDESGDWVVVAEKGRFERVEGGRVVKAFKWRLGESGPWSGLGDLSISDMPLYNLRLADQYPGAEVWVVEGEKAADIMVMHGFIAVCPAGGAMLKDYGDMFAPISGRKVIVWADNDGPGQIFANNVKVALAKAGIRSPVDFHPPINLPEKGDAFDFFQLGGTADQIKEKLKSGTLATMVVDILSSDEYRARYPTSMGTFFFHVKKLIALNSRTIEGHLSTGFLDGTAYSMLPYQRRINLLSNSQVVETRRDLEEIYKAFNVKQIRLTEILNQCVSAILEHCNNQDRSIDLADIPTDSIEHAIVDPIAMDGVPVVWYGDGGTSKSFLSFGLAAHFALGVPFCGMITPGRPALVVDYEGTQGSFLYRMNRVAKGMGIDRFPAGSIYYWNAEGLPLAEQVDAISQKVQQHNIGLVIIDSGAPATGGSPEDSSTVVAFFRGLAKIPAAKVVLCHVSKSGDVESPFGCYAETTEILTHSGWKYHDEWIEGEEIACFDPGSGKLTWSVPVKLWQYDYSGPMYRVKTSSSECLVTPNHRMVVTRADKQRKGRRWTPGKWDFVEAKDIPTGNFEAPLSVEWEEQCPSPSLVDVAGRTFDVMVLARFLGWWISEGAIEKADSGKACAFMIAQSTGSGFEDIANTMTAAGVEFSSWSGKLEYPGREHEKPMTYFRTKKSQTLAQWLLKECGDGALAKRLPGIVWSWPVEAKKELLEALIDGDGRRICSSGYGEQTRSAYYTISKRLANDVQRLAIEVGRSAAIRPRGVSQNGHHESYEITINSSTRTTGTIRVGRHFSSEGYSGKVYCFTTPTGAYLTRLNGKPMIAGNSVYWKNTPRRTFYIMKSSSSTSDTNEVSFICKKVNDGAMPDTVGIRVRFSDPGGPVSFERFDVHDDPELSTGTALKDQIFGVLRGKEMHVDQIVRTLNMPGSQTERVLRALEENSQVTGPKALFVRNDDGSWKLQGGKKKTSRFEVQDELDWE